jgi:serine/threonine protein kinase
MIETNTFAVKTLGSGVGHGLLQKEMSSLKRINGKHQHIVRLLATYTIDSIYHLIFPLAHGDLKTFWCEQSQNPVWDSDIDLDTVYWMSGQVLGLMDALDFIHGVRDGAPDAYGRHGKMEPENILWFPDSQNRRGRLVISNFDAAAFRENRALLNEEVVLVGIGTCQPPEFDTKDGRTSQAADIWSFGCVLLKFVCWAFGGHKLIREFADRRTTRYIAGWESDQFFDVVRELTGDFARVKPEVSGVSVIVLL